MVIWDSFLYDENELMVKELKQIIIRVVSLHELGPLARWPEILKLFDIREK